VDPEATLEALFGPLSWTEERTSYPITADDVLRRAEVTYRGVPLSVRRLLSTSSNTAGNTSRRWDCWLRAPLGAPAMCLAIGPPQNKTVGAALKTGDPAFDRALRVAGAPEGLLRAVLDARMREQLGFLMRYGVDVSSKRGNAVTMRVSPATEEHMDPRLLANYANTLVDLVTGLRAELERQHAQAAARGPGGVEAWAAQQRAEVTKYESSMGHLRGLLVYLVVLTILMFVGAGGCCLLNYSPLLR